MKKLLFAGLAAVSLLSLCAPACAMALRVSTPKIILELAPGETYSGEILAENSDAEDLKIRLYMEDWEYINGATGEKKFSPKGTTPMSASNWITFTPTNEVIPPYGKMTVRYTITVPQDVKGAYFSVLFMESLMGASQDEEGVNVLVAGRVGALILIEIKGTGVREGKIESVKLQAPKGNEPLVIETLFANTGNVDIALGGNFMIMDAQGKIFGRGELAKVYTFPGMTESSKTQWVGRLTPGDYQVLLTYDLGKGKTLVEEKTLSVA